MFEEVSAHRRLDPLFRGVPTQQLPAARSMNLSSGRGYFGDPDRRETLSFRRTPKITAQILHFTGASVALLRQLFQCEEHFPPHNEVGGSQTAK